MIIFTARYSGFLDNIHDVFRYIWPTGDLTFVMDVRAEGEIFAPLVLGT